MAKLRHIAISSQDANKTADFYMKVFGMKKLRTTDRPTHYGHILTDGYINLAVLNYKTDAVAGPEFGASFSGLHHIGFQVDSVEETAGALETNGGAMRDDIDEGFGIKPSGVKGKGEYKFGGPDKVIIDLSESGWQWDQNQASM